MTEVIVQRKRLLEDSFDITPAGLQFCFDRELFLKDEFNVDKFVMRQKKVVSLELLRDDLMQYFIILKNSLVELINQDYADFVNLSTNLVGLDKVICTIESPIEKWKGEIENVRNNFNDTLNEIGKRKLDLKILRSKKELIHSIEGVQRCIVRLEKWLNIKDANDNLRQLPAVCDIEIGLQEDVGQRLERIGNEFSKLEYFTRKCLQHTLVERNKPRIVTITLELQTQLEKHLVASFKDGNKKSIQQALRTYLGINKMSEAEQLYRDNFVRPLMEKLTTSKSNIEQDLPALYERILDMVDCLLAQLVDVLSDDKDGYELLKDFDFFVHSIYPEIAHYFINSLPNIFSPGNPDLFHTRYTCTMQFVEEMELRCRNVAQLKKLRNSNSYNDFINKWSVAVYFQIRYQDISSLIDKEVSRTSLWIAKPDGQFHFSMVSVIYDSILRCWADGIYLDALKHRLWRLNCQLLNFLVQFIEHIDWTKDDDASKSGADMIQTKTWLLVDLFRFLRVESMEIVASPTGYGLAWIYDDLMSAKLDDCLDDKGRQCIRQVLVTSTDDVMATVRCIASSIQASLTEQCMPSIKAVFDIPRQYRRTNRPWPTKVSDYVGNIFRPILKYLADNEEVDQIGQLKKELLMKCLRDITTSYHDQIKDLLLSVRKMEDSLKRLKQTRGGGTVEASGVDKVASTVTDDDKIRRQVVIDVEEFRKRCADIIVESSEPVSEMSALLALVADMST